MDELDYDDPISAQPEGSNIILKRHQCTLLHKALSFENGTDQTMVTKIGIIGDKVGSGKSYVILSIILSGKDHLKGRINMYNTYASGLITMVKHVSYDNLGGNIIVVPHNLIIQWSTYIKSFFKNDDVKYKILSRVKHIDEFTERDIYENDIIVVSSTLFGKFAWLDIVRNAKWSRIFFDEADNIHLPACRRLESRFYWFVTASIQNLLYPFGELKYISTIDRYIQNIRGIKTSGFIKDIFGSLFKSTDVCNSIVIKNKDSYVDESMKLPEIFTKIVECKSSLVLDMLKDYVNCEVMQALNAHDFKKAIECLNPKNKNTEDNLINVLIEKYKREINVIDAKISYTKELIYENEETKTKDIDKLNNEKDKIVGIIENIKLRVKSSTFCPICYNDYNAKSILNCCQNSFCFECLSKWIVNTNRCPMCNSHRCISDILVTVDMEKIEDVGSGSSSRDDLMDKFNTAMKIIRENPKGRFLILSSYDEPLIHLTPLLGKENISYAYLKGNHNCINNTIKKFNQNEINVLLINPKYHGCGLNLEHTSDIILFHKLDFEMEKQIIGRAQRLGRKDNLNVWYLLHNNEMV